MPESTRGGRGSDMSAIVTAGSALWGRRPHRRSTPVTGRPRPRRRAAAPRSGAPVRVPTAAGLPRLGGEGQRQGGPAVKLLVTGGAGYIGSVVTRLLLDAGHEVVVLDDLSTGYRAALPADATHVEVRIHDAAGALTPEAGFDGVLHFASLIQAGESMTKPEKYWDNNVVGSLRLLEATRAAGIRRFIFSSTAAVYGNPAEVPITEQAAKQPTNTYGATKLA